MKVQYNLQTDAMYIDLAKGKYSKTRKISDRILVDEDSKGKVLGIEILDAKDTVAAFDPQQTAIPVQSK
jgi:uncharacterized protein YuzE